MTWKIEYDRRVKKDLKKLDKQAQRDILEFFDNLPDDPTATGKPLKANFLGLWRYRIGDYRAICRLEDEAFIVLVLRVAHRKSAYQQTL